VASKLMAAPALAKPSGVAFSLKSVWIAQSTRRASPTQRPMLGRSSPANCWAGALTPQRCGAVWSRPKR
jgi:hypothetical protein